MQPRLLSWSIRCMLLAMAGNVHAQQAQQGAEQLPTVTVNAAQEGETARGPVNSYVAKRSATATKTDAALTETPSSISVVTREQMEAQQVRTLADAFGFSPGVYAPSTPFATTDSWIVLRGFPIANGGSVYRDGLLNSSNANYSRYSPEPYGLERAEVLRGPASVLYGQNQPGGVMNVVSKAPTLTPLHELAVETGSFNRKQVQGDFGGALDESGEWSYRLTGLFRKSDTQIDDTVDNRTFFAPAITWRPSARTELTLRAEYQRTEGLSNNSLPVYGVAAANPNGQIARNRVLGLSRDNDEVYEATSFGYQFSHQLDEVWTFRQNLRYSSFNGNRSNLRVRAFTNAQLNTVSLNNWVLHTDAETLVMDNQAQAKFSTGAIAHTVLGGLDFHHTAANLSGYTGLANPLTLNLYNPVYTPQAAVVDNYNRRTTDNQLGLYLQDQLKLGGWTWLLGVRHDRSRQSVENRLAAAANATTSASASANTANSGLVYSFANGLSPYVSYSESFLPVSGSTASGSPLKPETARQYEAGIKYEPKNFNALITLAAFDLRRRNVTTTDLANPTFSVQTGEVRARGIELEGKTSLSGGLNLSASYTFTDTRILSANDATFGKQLQRAPRNMASLWLDYTMQQGALAGLSTALGVRYVGPTFADSANTLTVPGFTLLDLALRYDLGRAWSSLHNIELALKLNNITDKVYATCGDLACDYGTRRNALAKLTYRW
ncbi:TonB-dependent siderophore receptor [Herbaspirillum lusitanum]|uniref:TonB-dependent siderophore receptor n=1 Tax=Herbaspirillum lusitanum TaxID=213312 RepID=A0ABW9ADI5_9BURK